MLMKKTGRNDVWTVNLRYECANMCKSRAYNAILYMECLHRGGRLVYKKDNTSQSFC